MQTIVIGCDNAAVMMKNILADYLLELGFPIEDMGCDSPSDSTNYPAIAKRVCLRIVESNYKKRGLLICGTGIGMCISANKFKGIRAAVCHDTYSAQRAILSNDGNVLCIGARVIGPELAKTILKTWATLEFLDGPSSPKVKEICDLETVNMK